MYYCDQCAKVRDYPMEGKQIRHTCFICGQIYLCSWADSDDLPLNNINPEIWETPSMTISQLKSFPPKPGNISLIQPNAINHRNMGTDCVLFFMGTNENKKREMIIANPLTGEQVLISYK